MEFSLTTSDGRKHTVTGGFVMTIYEEVPHDMPDYDYTDYIVDVVTLLHDRGALTLILTGKKQKTA